MNKLKLINFKWELSSQTSADVIAVGNGYGHTLLLELVLWLL